MLLHNSLSLYEDEHQSCNMARCLKIYFSFAAAAKLNYMITCWISINIKTNFINCDVAGGNKNAL